MHRRRIGRLVTTPLNHAVRASLPQLPQSSDWLPRASCFPCSSFLPLIGVVSYIALSLIAGFKCLIPNVCCIPIGTLQVLGEKPTSIGHVILHCLLADSESLCHFLLRDLLHPPHPNHF